MTERTGFSYIDILTQDTAIPFWKEEQEIGRLERNLAKAKKATSLEYNVVQISTAGDEYNFGTREKQLLKEMEGQNKSARQLAERRVTLNAERTAATLKGIQTLYLLASETPPPIDLFECREDIPNDKKADPSDLLLSVEVAKKFGARELAGNFLQEASSGIADPSKRLTLILAACDQDQNIPIPEIADTLLEEVKGTNLAEYGKNKTLLLTLKLRRKATADLKDPDLESIRSELVGVITAYDLPPKVILPAVQTLARYGTSLLAKAGYETDLGVRIQLDDLKQLAIQKTEKYRDGEDSSYIYNSLALLHAETAFYPELYAGKPVDAINRFTAEAKTKFPNAESILAFEKGVCDQYSTLCTNGGLALKDAGSVSAAVAESFAHLDDSPFLEFGAIAGGGVAGGGLVLLGVGSLGGPIGEGFALSTYLAIGGATGSLLAYGGVKAYNLYSARENIAQSYQTGYSSFPVENVLMRANTLPIEIAAVAWMGSRFGVNPFRKFVTGELPLPFPESPSLYPALGFASGKPTQLELFFANGKSFIGKVANTYDKLITSWPVVSIGAAAVAADLALDRDYNLEWDGLSHPWGFAAATLILGNAIFPRLIGVSPWGNAVGCALGTSFQFYFQHDAGRNIEFFDYNRAFAGYGFMLGSSFTGNTVLKGSSYWEKSVVGRLHLKLFNGIDETFGSNIMGRNYARALILNETNMYGAAYWESGFGRFHTNLLGRADNIFGSNFVGRRNFIGFNGAEPILSPLGRIKLSFYNTFLMGLLNVSTAWLQGIDLDRSTAVRVAKMWTWNILFGPLQAKHGFSSAKGFVYGKPTGEFIQWAYGLLFNMFGKQALHEYPTLVWLDSSRPDHEERINDEDKRNELLDMIRRGTMIRSLESMVDRQFVPVTVEKFSQFVAGMNPQQKNEFEKLLAGYVRDAADGKYDIDTKRTVEMMVVAYQVASVIPKGQELDLFGQRIQIKEPISADFKAIANDINNGTYDSIFDLNPNVNPADSN